MAELVGDRVWQCSHFGGHRFGANCLFMPDGICYGHLDESDMVAFVEDCRNHRVNLTHYRGRSHYAVQGQVGEYFLRQQTGVIEAGYYHLTGIEAADENHWIARFDSLTKETYAIHIEATLSDWQDIQSCSQMENKQVPQYQMVDYEIVNHEQQGNRVN